ncbi:MAG TPA: biotin carboxylase N-terminal domain-containing protein [Pseudolabrys sp.]|nr:biotin carboxylase N-terminal domain-containing protein [Pseudolabrys sp.]
MFSSVLIANRGEIACRIARTAKSMGLRTIAVYSEADAHALHVRLCDEAFPIGRAPAAESYLAIEKVIAAARAARADCVHPGYGFLSENARFAQACSDAGIAFVGPPPAAMQAMGLKDQAKALMEAAGVPVVPGYHGERQEPEFLKQKAYEIGYPVLIKAVAGGGGRGMRRVDKHADFEAALQSAQREAVSSFGDARMLVEKYIAAPRHIEMQIFGDSHGNVIHLNERDCSLQRRHQKVIEEAPAPGMTAELRATMGAAAIKAARAVGYIGAGTVEFIVDGSHGLRPDAFWFMEMNTRLQVEHPVTEAVTGLDLVEWQFRIAAGEKLSLSQAQVPLNGHAVEARLYAEDAERNFLPSTGRLLAFKVPEGKGIRVDTGFECGDEITPFYDPLLAKVIAHGPTRKAALNSLADALSRTVVAGPRSNAGFLATLCQTDAFHKGDFDTDFIERNLDRLGATRQPLDLAAAVRGAARLLERERERLAASPPREPDQPPSPWDATDAFQLSGTREISFPVAVDGDRRLVQLIYRAGDVSIAIDGEGPAADAKVIDTPDGVLVLHRGRQTRISLQGGAAADVALDRSSGTVRAPMHGKVLDLFVEQGARVTRGQRLAVIEAMKMEHTLTAPFDGVVSSIGVSRDAQVAEGAYVMTITPRAVE